MTTTTTPTITVNRYPHDLTSEPQRREPASQPAAAVRYPWLLVRTALHGGGIVSRHTTVELAQQAQTKHASESCTCGCAGVVAAGDFAGLPHDGETRSPYALVQ